MIYVTEEDMKKIRIMRIGRDAVIFTYTGDDERGFTAGDRITFEFGRPVIVEDHSGEEPYKDGYVTPEHRYAGLARVLSR